jgi:hypothetical protein
MIADLCWACLDTYECPCSICTMQDAAQQRAELRFLRELTAG